MAIGVQRQTEMNPITIVFAGINDHLHSRVSEQIQRAYDGGRRSKASDKRYLRVDG